MISLLSFISYKHICIFLNFLFFCFEKLNFGEKIEVGFFSLDPCGEFLDPDLDPYGEFLDPGSGSV